MNDKKVIFISHSSKDRDKVELLAEFIKKVSNEQFGNEYKVYYAPNELPRSVGVDSTDKLIIERIRSAHYLIVFYTPNAVFSRWVHFEVGVAKNYNIKIIPFVKDGVDCSALIGNIPRTNMEEPQCIKNLLCRIFNKTDGNEPEWLSLYKEEMAHLHYTFKSKTAYIVGSKSLICKKRSDETTNVGTPPAVSEQNKTEEDSRWNTERANRFVREITEGFISNEFILASFPKVPTIGRTVANLCAQRNYKEYKIAGLYAFDNTITDALSKIDLPEEISDRTIAHYRQSYLRDMDVQIIIGGNTNTRNEYYEAKKRLSLQIFPIPCFGGVGYEIYHKMKLLQDWNKYKHPCCGCDFAKESAVVNSSSYQCPNIRQMIERMHQFIPIESME